MQVYFRQNRSLFWRTFQGRLRLSDSI